MIDWLEISADYECNNRCLGCFSVADGGPSLTTEAVFDALRSGRRDGASRLWLGGGEPTLRKDLFRIAGAARKLGYRTVKLQTNGMMLAYPEFTERCRRAGITTVSFSLKGATASTHDRLTRTPGCFDHLQRGVAEAREQGLELEGDILAYRSNLEEIPAMVSRYRALGLGHFDVWLLSLSAAAPGEHLEDELPRMEELVGRVCEAMDAHPDHPGLVRSLHTPACTVPPSHHRCLFFAREMNLRVVDASGGSFRLERSSVEGGRFEPGCQTCRFESRCNGLRTDYLKVWGSGIFQPVPEGPPRT